MASLISGKFAQQLIQDGAQDDSFKNAYSQAQENERQRRENDARLAQLIKGKQLEDESYNMKRQKSLEDVKSLRQLLGKDAGITAGDVHIDPRQKQASSALVLTPAQQAAERAVGKQIADFDAAGGRPAMEKNLQALTEVQADLTPDPKTKQTKRDWWDRNVGGVLSTSPALMGLFASGEKARRDKARNTALTIARQTDPNPTEKQIEAIMGQIYDTSSSDEDNEARITRFLNEQRSKAAQMEAASQNYHNSGYATIGGARAPQSVSGASAYSDEEDGTVDDAGAEAAYQQAVREQGRSAAPETKVISGHTYQRVQGGWKRVK